MVYGYNVLRDLVSVHHVPVCVYVEVTSAVLTIDAVTCYGKYCNLPSRCLQGF